MNPSGKKFISLFIFFSLLVLSVSLYAKERRGATLIVQRKSDQLEKTRLEGTPWGTSVKTGIRGELIGVKQNSLLLLNTEGEDVSIADIRAIRIVKKSQIVKGALAGLLLSVGIAVIGEGMLALGAEASVEEPVVVDWGAVLLDGVIVGAIIGAFAGIDKTIQIEGMTDSEIKEVLERLRKKARIRNYK